MPDTPVVDLDALDDDGRYLAYHAARDKGATGYAEHRRDVRELLELEVGARVVEVGCGTGAHLPHLFEMVGANGYVLGADGSQKMLELAEARLVTAGVQPLEDGSSQNGVGLLHARLDSMTSALGEFDVVLADRLIGHLDDPRLGLEQLGGLCRRGGRVVVVNMLNSATVVNLGADEAARRLAHRVLAWRSERGTTSAWAAPVVPSLAVQAGLQPVDVRYWTFPCRSLAATYPHSPLIEYGDHAAHDGAISESDAALWRQLLSATDRDGLFSALFVVRADVLIRP